MSGSWRTRIAGHWRRWCWSPDWLRRLLRSTASPTNHTGTISDGGSWIADGTVAVERGGALQPRFRSVGRRRPQAGAARPRIRARRSSYDARLVVGVGWRIVRDQFEALSAARSAAVEASRSHRLRHVDGGASQRPGERARSRPHRRCADEPAASWPVPSTCATYAMAKLLAPAVPIELVRFANADEGLATASSSMRSRSRRRARRKVVRVSRWRWPSSTCRPGRRASRCLPPATTSPKQSAFRREVQSGPFTTMDFIESQGRPSIEQAAGGNPSWTVSMSARQLARSPYAPQVRALYRQAGLDLRWTSEP